VRLGGYVILPRMLDKGRATVAGKHGEYHYNCPMDERFLNFVGVSADALKKQLAAGKGDAEVLDWIQKHGKHKRTEPEIVAWSAYQEQRAPADTESREYFHELHGKVGPNFGPQTENLRYGAGGCESGSAPPGLAVAVL
jgi:hypothetical protein